MCFRACRSGGWVNRASGAARRVGWFAGFGVDPAIPPWLRAKGFVKDKKSSLKPAACCTANNTPRVME